MNVIKLFSLSALLISNSIIISAESSVKSNDISLQEQLAREADIDTGLFNVYSANDKFYFEIPDALFGREMLLVTRRAKTAMDMGFGGELLDSRIFTWENRNDKIVDLKVHSFRKIAGKDNNLKEAVETSLLPTILKSLPIEYFTADSSAVIDVTELFRKDDLAFGLDSKVKKDYGIVNLTDNSSYIKSIRSFPENVEISTVKTYSISGQGRVVEDERLKTVTLELHNSMLLLPEEPMMPRYADERIGYFTHNQWDYSSDKSQSSVRSSYITRWRMEPKDTAAFLRGELTEPVKPIIYYLSPSIPDQWVPYFIKGVEAWQPAFEQAGFKNAIQARHIPDAHDDPDFDPLDARYSMIEYFASYVENAYGPHVSDPRSGEIIETHVCIFHNVLKLVHDWYMIQCGAQDPNARKMVYDEELMGRLVQYIVTHEVGHTLGLAHNFASSNAFPVDSLRSSSFTHKNGTTPSVMDYARFNYVAQPEDEDIYMFPKLGDYDRYAIEWGYRPVPGAQTPEDERLVLNRFIKEHADDPRYRYIRQFLVQFDPRGQSEDLGDDAVKASALGLKNLKIVVRNLDKWTAREGYGNRDLSELYDKACDQWVRYMRHVYTCLGGVYEDYKSADQPGDVFRPVEKEKQQAAIRFIAEHALNTPEWLMNPPYIGRINSLMLNTRSIQDFQSKSVDKMMNIGVIMRITDSYHADPENAYNPLEYLSDVRKAVWADLEGEAESDLNRRVLQRTYLDCCRNLLNWSNKGGVRQNLPVQEYKTLLRLTLKDLVKDLKHASRKAGDPVLKQHYEDSFITVSRLLVL